MKVEMKEFEVWCGEYAERWNKGHMWEYYCLVKDAWINGFKRAREEATRASDISQTGEAKVEVEVASNQIGGGNK